MKTKLLFLMSSLRFGGAEKQTIDLVNNLNQEAYELSLCYFKKEESLIGQIKENTLSHLICLDKKGRFDLPGLFSRLNKFIKKIDPEIVVCVDPYPAIFAHMVRFFCRKKFLLVQVLHMTDMKDQYYEFYVKYFYRHLINHSDKVVFVCNNQKFHWIRKYSIRKSVSSVIHNGVDVGWFGMPVSEQTVHKLKNQFAIKNNEVVVGINAAMRVEKHHADLLDAVRIILSENIPVKVVFIGDGSERENIEKHVDKLGMRGVVGFAGFQQDVRPYLAVLDILVIASWAVETFSIAILEGMACGLPIVATDIGGADEQILDGENGFLYRPGDVVALAEQLKKMIIQNMIIEMGDKSKELVVNKFTLPHMVKNYEALFEEIQKG